VGLQPATEIAEARQVTAQGGSSLKFCAVAKLSIIASARIMTIISITVSYHITRKLSKIAN